MHGIHSGLRNEKKKKRDPVAFAADLTRKRSEFSERKELRKEKRVM